MSELAQGFSDGHSINGSQETSASTARGFYGFCLTSTTELIRPIRLIRGRKSQLIQDVANEAEGLFRYFKRSPKEYSA